MLPCWKQGSHEFPELPSPSSSSRLHWRYTMAHNPPPLHDSHSADEESLISQNESNLGIGLASKTFWILSSLKVHLYMLLVFRSLGFVWCFFGGCLFSCGTLWLIPKLWSPHHWRSIQDYIIDSSGPNNLQDLSTSISSRFESNQETLNFAISIVQQIIPSIWISLSSWTFQLPKKTGTIQTHLGLFGSASTCSNFPMYPIQDNAEVATSRNLKVARWSQPTRPTKG